MPAVLAVSLTLAASAPSSHAADDDEAFAWQAPIAVERSAAFVELPLDLATYAHLEQPELGDLRILDSRGRRVPFAVLPALRPALAPEVHDGRLYAWPATGEPRGGVGSSSGWTVELQDGRVVVRGTGSTPPDAARSPGWLIDTAGDRRPSGEAGAPNTTGPRHAGGNAVAEAATEADAHTLSFAWQDAAEFNAAYRLDSSDDLQSWRPAGSGQLLSLASAGDTLAQRAVALPAGHGRFVRLLWRDPASAPRLTGVQVSTTVDAERFGAPTIGAPTSATRPATTATTAAAAASASPVPPASDGTARNVTAASRDSIVRVEVAPAPAASSAAGARSGRAAPAAASRAIDFDLGAALPLSSVELLLPPGNWVAPIVVYTRASLADPWDERARTVVYRLERPAAPGGTGSTGDAAGVGSNSGATTPTTGTAAAGAATSSHSPPIPLPGTARHVRVVTDARVAALDPADTRLAARAQLARLVFAAQGSPPFLLVAGTTRPSTTPAALPVDTLVPSLAVERAAFGTASVGAWTEVESTRKLREKQRDDAALHGVLRPVLLWAVLLAGVAGLGFMAWRLMRAPASGGKEDLGVPGGADDRGGSGG